MNIGIKIIDAPCGYGKTAWAINELMANPDKAYIYCTPFLDEITRIREECGKRRFKEPQPYNGAKIDDFNDLLAMGESIAVTHSTFLNATPETLERIHEGEYTLILDEVLDVITDFNKISTVEESPRQSMSDQDIQTLIEKGIIKVGEKFKVMWCDKDYGRDSKFYEVMRLAKLGRLYLARDRLLVTVYPVEMFQQFNDVLVLTYMFDGSILKNYFDIFGLDYEVMSIDAVHRVLIPYEPNADFEFRNRCKELISVYDGKLNRPGRTLSSSWYDRAPVEAIKRLKNDVGEYFNRIVKQAKASSEEIMWTCPKRYMDKIVGKGYTCARRMTSEEKNLPEQERKKLEKRLNCFVPCNAKATNEYGNTRWALAYCYNMYPEPMIKGMIEDCGVKFNEKAYALSCLIQWVCRSRIRNGQAIALYIPSPRMRKLFSEWLSCGRGSSTSEAGKAYEYCVFEKFPYKEKGHVLSKEAEPIQHPA